MKRMLCIASLLFAAVPAFSDQSMALGDSSLTLWLDRDAGAYSIDITETPTTEIRGQSSFGNGLFRLTREGGTWKGFADDGFVDLTCSETACEGIVGSDSTRATMTREGDTLKIKGSMNHVYVEATISPSKIEVRGDGSMELAKDKKKEGLWHGSGYLNTLETRFDAELRARGSLVSRLSGRSVDGSPEPTDLGLFLIYVVSPLVRN
jgi:hypothetical protein